MCRTGWVSKAAEAANKAFTTGDSIIGGRAENRALRTARDVVGPTLGCIYNFGIQGLIYLASETKDILARNLMEILQEAKTNWCFVPLLSDMQLTIVKSSYIFWGANLSPEDYDEACNDLKKDIAKGVIPQRIFFCR